MAHVAAHHGHIPDDFDRWDIVDRRGWSVAHDAAINNNLPGDFDQWDLTDVDGVTVRNVADRKISGVATS